MQKFLLTISVFALLLLGAHSLRLGDFGLATAFAIVAGLMFTQREWVRLVAVCALLWGGYIWADVTVQLVSFRQAFDMPWKRLGLIMAGVIVFDGLALLALVSRPVQDFFRKQKTQGIYQSAIFILVIFGLAMARSHISFPILLADRYFPGWGWLEIVLLALYAQWIGGLMLAPRGQRRYRPRIWGLFSAVFFLQLFLGLLGMESMLMTGSLHLPVPALIVAGPVFRGTGFFMPILFCITLLLVGPAWCSHLCYVGAWDDGLSRLGKRPAPNATLRRLSFWGRGATLVLAVGAAFTLRSLGVPGMTAILLAAGFGLVGVGVMVFVSRRMGMVTHCTALCPMGLVANFFGKMSPWRIRVGADCNKCGACFTRCRFNALDEVRVELGSPAVSCTLCGDCLSACAHNQIKYRFPGLSPDVARQVFVVLVVSLHALFLGVARI